MPNLPAPLPRVYLAHGRQQRLLAGHPWVYRTEVESLTGNPAPGDIVNVVDHRNHFLGRGYFNPNSMIVVRLLTHDPRETVDEALLARRLAAAWQHRCKYLAQTHCCRVVFAEADLLPGLIVDKFGDVLVIQTLTLGIDRWKAVITRLLTELIQPRAIFERNDVPVRALEGIPEEKGLLYGDSPDRFWVQENGLAMLVDVMAGQKTGHFADQRENRAAVRPYCRGARVLDAFSHTGGFALNAAAAGATEVVAVDISAAALAVLSENAAQNGLDGVITTREANVFDYLREAVTAGQPYDVVILDPPAFAKNRKALEGAVRGYKEINLRAMKLLPPGGILITCSCSYHMTSDLFREVVAEASDDAHRRLRLLEERSQPLDHPVLVGYEESHYLKCLVLQVL